MCQTYEPDISLVKEAIYNSKYKQVSTSDTGAQSSVKVTDTISLPVQKQVSQRVW